MSMDLPPIPAEREALDRLWRVWASVIVGAFVLVSLILGLIVLPIGERRGFDPFAAICRAIGIPGYDETASNVGAAASAPASDVAWSVDTRRLLADARANEGAILAQGTCAACHGGNGVTVDPSQFPSLAGQAKAALFKQIRDFQTGARKSDIMTPMAQRLTQQQMADIAAYYATRASADLMVAESGVPLEISHLAQQGDPVRAIASCDSCHGSRRSGPEEAPILLGQSTSYLEQQLKNFAANARSNDTFERMRTIAGELTPDEMHRLAIYYGGMPARH